MSKPGTNWQSPDMAQRLAKRYAAERRFKRLGVLALFVLSGLFAYLHAGKGRGRT
jgi:phosphate transport system permease protein